MALNPETKITVKVTKTDGLLQTYTPVTIKNQVREYQINSITDLPDVSGTANTTGQTLIYNLSTGNFEVSLFDVQYLVGIIDSGEF